MKFYADSIPHRGRQLVGDLGLVVWVLLAIWLAEKVHDATLKLAAPGYQIESAGSGLADKLASAGDSISGIPYVGDDVAKPFAGASSSADQISNAGRSQVEAVQSLAHWLGIAVALIPILMALLAYLPFRIRFIRRATAGKRFLDSGADLDLFALRALSHQPLHVLAQVSADPAMGWRRRDPEIVRRLATLELKDVGLSPPPSLLAQPLPTPRRRPPPEPPHRDSP